MSTGQRVVIAICGLGVLGGWALCIVGLAQTFEPYDAADDFKKLSSPCIITGVSYNGTSETARHNHATKGTDRNCYDVYTYDFAWCQDGTDCDAGPTQLLSAGESVSRSGSCSGSSQRNSTHSEGASVECYQPTGATPVDAAFESRYACGNAECIKLADPALALEASARTDLYDLLYFGAGVSVFFMLLVSCFVRKYGGLSSTVKFVVTGDEPKSVPA